MKRFTETDKWSDPWFQSLTPGSKLLFVYICDRCNNAGFYEENVREACFHIGVTEEQYKGALKGLDRGFVQSSGWIWVKNFLKHQKNLPLNPENPAHKQIILFVNGQLNRFKENQEFSQFVAPLKGLLSPIGNSKGKGNGLGKERGVGKTNEVAEEIYQAYPRHEGHGKAIEKIEVAIKNGADPVFLLDRVKVFSECVKDREMQFIAQPATWFHQERWKDDEKVWLAHKETNNKNGTHAANTTKDHEQAWK